MPTEYVSVVKGDMLSRINLKLLLFFAIYFSRQKAKRNIFCPEGANKQLNSSVRTLIAKQKVMSLFLKKRLTPRTGPFRHFKDLGSEDL